MRTVLELIKKGLTRIEAYDIVQDAALNMNRENIDFEEALKKNKKIRRVMNSKEVEGCFDLSYHTGQIDKIFKKAGIR